MSSSLLPETVSAWSSRSGEKYRASMTHSSGASGIRPAVRLRRFTSSVMEWARTTRSAPSSRTVRKSVNTAPRAAPTPASPAKRATSSSVNPRVERRRKS